MEPTHNNLTDAHELPQPQEVGSGHIAEGQPAASPETQTNPPVAGMPAAPLQAVAPLQQPPASAPQPPMPQSMSNSSATQHLIADDADLIEKEWVSKAKAIVAQTKSDPHQQNQEMTKVKADYLKKRYNKDLKVSEG